MQFQFTPAAQRALRTAAEWSSREDSDELEAPGLLLGLLAESECRAGIMLAGHRIDASAVRRRWPGLMARTPPNEALAASGRRFSAEVELSIQLASDRFTEFASPVELATEHLLLGLLVAGHEVSDWLRQQGLEPGAVQAEIHKLYGHHTGPLTVQPLELGDDPAASPLGTAPIEVGGHEGIPLLRVIDASANRAREGLRAVEDYVRFILDDAHLTGLCKELRHDLAAAVGRIPAGHRLAARDTRADVGTELNTPTESRRNSPDGVLAANLSRLQEALRSLEEYGKLIDVELGTELKRLRYRSYTLQRAVDVTRISLDRLDPARLYVLIDGCSSEDQFRQLAGSLVDAGVDMIQLRDKTMADRPLLERARLLRELTGRGDTLLIVNDRPDLAVLSRADGIHVGQEELSVKDARTVVGPEALVGVSTHTLDQARQAQLDGANYIGVGPVFPSGTKRFDEFPGVELLRAVSSEIRLPAFAVGGITHGNLPDVLATGVTRVAVSGAVANADDPAAAARRLAAAICRTREPT